ncbi:MAG: ABC transporter substrate-binding protein [Sporichthyaceae bacterium]|nr:ABC transporter substrate-binding protein [Sporichthyaceae bacterium]
MTGPVRRVRLAALAAMLSLTATACGGTLASSSSDASTPREGGTLRLVGSGDIDHLDPASSYYVPTWRLLRTMVRQLVTYPYSADQDESTTPVADLAVSVPEPTNEGRTYTFRIREGAVWDAPDGPRQVTADDVVRGFERLCNPVWPNPAPGYFNATIEGFAEYCTSMSQIEATTTAIRDFIDSNEIPGVRAVDELTVEFNLHRPAGDFVNILALSFATPMPEESLKYKPDSPEFRRNFISNGPYKIERYLANQSITLIRNENWDPQTDPVRKAWVDQIEVVIGSDEGPVQKQMEAGTADLAWDTLVPVSDLHRLRSVGDPGLTVEPDGSINYLVMNLRDDQLDNSEVRRAINTAIDKTAIVKIMGGPSIAEPINRILPPQIAGGELTVESPFLTEGDKGDPDAAKQILSDAGISGVSLKMPYRNSGKAPSIAQAIQQDLGQAGIDVELIPTLPNLFYTNYLFQPEADWDIAVPGWLPDWYGNAGRSFFVPLLDGRTCGPNSSNFGCYNSRTTNDLIDQALEAATPEEAAALWAQADQQATEDAAWVPLITFATPHFHSDRVGNYLISLGTNGPDLTNVWIVED